MRLRPVILFVYRSGGRDRWNPISGEEMRTGMEPFFAFVEAVRYAFDQIGMEYRAAREYRRNVPRTSQNEIAPSLSAKQGAHS
jgi:hypothetical protein